jgi:hypothetical protein
MSLHYFPPDETLQQRAAAKMKKMLLLKSFMERWEPVQKETLWVINGRKGAKHHKKLLPDYCYHILDLHRRTLYKLFTPISDVISIKNKKKALKAKTVKDAKKAMTIEWEKLGAVFEMGERCIRFYENEFENKLRRDGLLSLKKKAENEIYRLVFGNAWIEKRIAEIQATDPKAPLEEIIAKRCAALDNTTKMAIPEWHQKAGEWEAGAVPKFHRGVTKGSEGFLDKNGEFHGEKKLKLKRTYEMLLLAWPEINEMLRAKPPKTRNHLWEWLQPFSYARWIEIEDLEQLNRLCNEIKLRLKKPGAPFKANNCSVN